MKSYRSTIAACFVGYSVQAVINNFAPLLFLTFQSQYQLPISQITLLVSFNFLTQLAVDFAAIFFVDRIGYENWDPFQKPNEPLDMRTDVSQRTTQHLVNAFLKDAAQKGPYGKAYSKGATECALGVVNKDEKYMGIFDFCRWYYDLLKKEGHIA